MTDADAGEPRETTGDAGAGSGSPAARLRAVASAVAVGVGGFATSLLFTLVAGSVLSGLGVPLSPEEPLAFYPASIVLQGLAFGVVVYAFVAVADAREAVAVRLPSPAEVGLAVAGTIALFALLAAINVVYAEFGVTTARSEILRIGRETPRLLLYLVPLALLVIGPSEELLFRGAIQGGLRRVYAPAPAILIASALFALAHFSAVEAAAGPGARAATLTAILVLSLVFGVLYEYTDNVVVPALAHGLYNAVTFAVVYLQATGAV